MSAHPQLSQGSFPTRLTLVEVVRMLRVHWRKTARSPIRQRVWQFRWWLELLLYGWWQHTRGRKFELPVETGSAKAYRITKQIPGVAIRVFGRMLWLVVPVALEKVPVEDPEPQPPPA